MAFINTFPTTSSKFCSSPKSNTCTHHIHHFRACATPPPKDYNNNNNWSTLGKGVASKGVQRIEFVIHPGGKVEELVTGVRGKACENVTEKINQALGDVKQTEYTPEYYEQPVQQVTDSEVAKNEVKWTGGEDYQTW